MILIIQEKIIANKLQINIKINIIKKDNHGIDNHKLYYNKKRHKKEIHIK